MQTIKVGSKRFLIGAEHLKSFQAFFKAFRHTYTGVKCGLMPFHFVQLKVKFQLNKLDMPQYA
mgnify:FL=1